VTPRAPRAYDSPVEVIVGDRIMSSSDVEAQR